MATPLPLVPLTDRLPRVGRVTPVAFSGLGAMNCEPVGTMTGQDEQKQSANSHNMTFYIYKKNRSTAFKI